MKSFGSNLLEFGRMVQVMNEGREGRGFKMALGRLGL